MGYTTYWRNIKFSVPQWLAFRADVKVFLSNLPSEVLIQREYDIHKKPLVGMATIAFNGVGEEGHETFYFEKKSKDFNFCKTARKPYDLAVCGVLMLASLHATSGEISSDGFQAAHGDYPEYVDQEWKDAWKHFQTVYKIGTKEQIFKLFPDSEVLCRLIDA